ncbi:hypothetical protein [Nostoc sp. ChiQUE01b]|uniref:hypothetical protein n=1 Tax=Nostoc sp. ChiQUE01b TaxID=3075376 RepID=UPI002AD36C28|nr:hypothetical protein [Nostoc sp. ChiQUE01b]MDZ8260060.1 hypothetical protein [Nostoc sp. ChiQUE01b]
MRSQRCLVIFDNVETILQHNDKSKSSYIEGYEAYGEIFRQIGEIRHQSCLVITSRDQPPEIRLLEGASLPVRAFQLSGLQKTEAQQLLQLKGNFQGSKEEWNRLVEGYAANPLALKIIATTIQKLFDGSISDFLKQETLVIGNIRNLISQQFERLSESEKTVIYWLAIYRDSASFAELRSDIFPPISPQNLIEVLESLEQRSLIEKSKLTLIAKHRAQFSLQPMVMEYVTEKLVAQVCQEILAGLEANADQKNLLFKTHALLRATAQDYVRETQVRFILKPILERLLLDRLLIEVSEKFTIENLLTQCLNKLRGISSLKTGYAGGNILNLLCQLQSTLTNYDFSNLTIWQAYLQDVNLHNVNFESSDLSQCVFAETFGMVFAGIAFSPDGTLLAIGDAEGELRLWEVATGKLVVNFAGHLGWVWSVAFSPDGQILSSASEDETVRLWSVDTGECLNIFQGHSNSVWSVAFSPEGDILAGSSLDQTVRIWDRHTGVCLKVLPVMTHAMRSAIAFGNFTEYYAIASGSQNGTIQIWDAQTGESLKILNPDRPYQGTNITNVTGITTAQKDVLKALGAFEI